MQRYPTDTLWDEITFLAFHLGWNLDDLLDLEHRDRRRLVDRVGALDARQRAIPAGAPRPLPSPPFPGTNHR